MDSTVHRLVKAYGLDEGLQRARQQGCEPRLVEVARRFYESGELDLGVNYAGLCILNLPHRPLPKPETVWLRELKRTGFSCKLIIEPGMLDIGGNVQRFGVPYGVTGRLILLYLQKQALVGGSREIELGSTMYEWMKRLGVGLGGKDYKHVREQMFRISACSLRFLWGGQDETGAVMSGWKKDSIIEEGILMIGRDGDEHQPALWRERIVLSATFFEALRERPVPIDLNAVRAINYSSRALDIYIWLAYRLHTLKRPMKVTWPMLREQFGEPEHRLDRFRDRFSDALKIALQVYPVAKVEADASALTLHPSPPAVPERPMLQVVTPSSSAAGEALLSFDRSVRADRKILTEG
jgi:hypothetical protein